jgi:hypothetical protein
MKQKYLVPLILAVAVLAFVGGFALHSNSLGGAFAGGITPNQLFTGNATTNSVTPVTSNLYLNGALSVGGQGQYNQLAAYATASGTPATVATLGLFGQTTSSATTSLTVLNTAGLSVGAICSGGAATTTVFVSGCVLTSTNNVTGTATVAYTNVTGASLAVPTSTRLNISFDQLPY